MNTGPVTAAVLSLILLFSGNSLAGSPVHGSKAAAMGTAFVGIADDPSAILYNPAGLTSSKGTNVYSGATAIIPSSEYKSPSGQSENTEFQVFFPPHLYFSSDLKTQNMVFGLGIYSPFGIGGRQWSETGLTKYASTENTISTLAANPVFAWRPLPWLSIGAGLYYMRSKSEAERMIDQSSLGTGDGKQRLEMDGGGWGYNLGVLLFQGEKLSFGFAYRSHSKVDQDGSLSLENIAPPLQQLFGGSSFKTDVSSSLDFPQVVSAGIAYRPSNSWTIGLDFEWLGWSSFDKANLDLSTQVPEAGVTDSTIDFDFRDTWQIKAGVEYQATERLALRGGYAFVTNPVPEHTLNPGNPDSDQHNFSVGFGYKWNKIWVDAFYMADIFQDRKVNNSILSGSYESLAHMMGMSAGYRF